MERFNGYEREKKQWENYLFLKYSPLFLFGKINVSNLSMKWSLIKYYGKLDNKSNKSG